MKKNNRRSFLSNRLVKRLPKNIATGIKALPGDGVFRWKRLLGGALFALALFAAAGLIPLYAAKNAPSPKIVAYLPLWEKWQPNEIDALKLTHLNLAFAGIRDGVIVNPLQRAQLKTMRRLKRRNPALQVLISIGGWGGPGFSDAALTPDSCIRFADSVAAYLRRYKLDGADIDWEFPVSGGGTQGRPEDKENFTLLMLALRDKLDEAGRRDNKHYLLTFAANISLFYIDSVQLDKLAPLVDFINLMTYDFHGSWDKITGFHTNLYSAAADPTSLSADYGTKRYLKAGVPPEKLVLGTAFYGRGWSGVTNLDNGRFQPASGASKSYRYQDLAAHYINRNGFLRYWDDQAKAPYLWNGDTFITYEDEESLNYRAIYIRSNQLGGIMIWQYCQDGSGVLLNKIYRELNY